MMSKKEVRAVAYQEAAAILHDQGSHVPLDDSFSKEEEKAVREYIWKIADDLITKSKQTFVIETNE
jgi:hypothetical protein